MAHHVGPKTGALDFFVKRHPNLAKKYHISTGKPNTKSLAGMPRSTDSRGRSVSRNATQQSQSFQSAKSTAKAASLHADQRHLALTAASHQKIGDHRSHLEASLHIKGVDAAKGTGRGHQRCWQLDGHLQHRFSLYSLGPASFVTPVYNLTSLHLFVLA